MKRKSKAICVIGLSISILSNLIMPVYADEKETQYMDIVEENTEPEAEVENNKLFLTWGGVLNEGNRCYYDADGQKVTGLQAIGGKTYYFSPDGILQTGWQIVGEETYYFALDTGERYEDRKELIDDKEYLFDAEGKFSIIENETLTEEKLVGVPEDDKNIDEEVQEDYDKTSPAVNNNIKEQKKAVTGWQEDGDKRYYIMPDGKIHTGWLSFGKTYYYCGQDGFILYGKQKIGGAWYYFNEKGVRQQNSWIKEDGKNRYYALADGKLRVGWLSFGKTYYYCGKDGAILYGKQKIDNDWYFFNDTGVRQQNKWIREDGNNKYYALADGKLRVGWLSFGSTYYYCGKDALILYGKQKIGADWYYFDERGVRQYNTWIKENGKNKYYALSDGKLRVGWLSFGKTYYYCRLDGTVAYGKLKIKGDWYYFNDAGVRQQSRWIEENGEKKYYALSDGKLRTGWLSFGKTYYYCRDDAQIVKNLKDYPVDGVKYTFDTKGVMKIESGWGNYNGNKYYKNPATGMPYKNQWVSFGKTYYYANSKGHMVYGWQTIGGYRYYFDPTTKIMARNTTIDGVRIGVDGKASEAYAYAVKVLNQVGWNLRSAFNWSASLRYRDYAYDASPGSEKMALQGFKNGVGDCYVMAATFYYMAKQLNYDAYQIDGYVLSAGGGREVHSWVEIVISGKTYVFDPAFHGTGRNGYQIYYGMPGTWRYTSYYRMN